MVKVTKTPPPSYEKKQQQKNLHGMAVKISGNQACDAPPC